MTTCNIYTLSDPDTLEVRYVGQTIHSLKNRLKMHINETKVKKSRSYKNNWVKSLLKNNKTPVIELIEEGVWNESEIYWIAQFKAWGFNLTNHTLGGGGMLGIKVSDETRKKQSLLRKGKKASLETCKKLSEMRKGVPKPRHNYAKFIFISPDNKIFNLTIKEGAEIINCKKDSIYQSIWRNYKIKGWMVLSNCKKKK